MWHKLSNITAQQVSSFCHNLNMCQIYTVFYVVMLRVLWNSYKMFVVIESITKMKEEFGLSRDTS